MNKTININLGGFFFHIDETAYQILKNYLESIARSLHDDPQGKNEIIADIEARISELLSEKINDPRQVINENDINDIINIMGQPEDYEDAGEDYSTNQTNYKQHFTNKKLYRDGDDKFLGGVAAGIGHYFAIDSTWIRLLFILLAAFGGFGIPAYIILWILLPEAKTTAEKLQMEGEAVNIDNIEKKIRTEFESVSEKFKNADYSKAKSSFQYFIDSIGKLLLLIFKASGKVIGVLLMFISAAVLLSLLVGGFSLGSFEIIGIGDNFVHLPPFFYNSVIPRGLLTAVVFISIGFPFFILFILGLRLLSKSVKQLSKTTSLTLLGIWLVSILTLGFAGIEYSSAHSFDGSKISENTFEHNVQDTLQIKMVNKNELYYKHYFRRSSTQEIVYENDVKKLYCTNVKVNVVQSETDKATINIRKESQDKDRNQATENATQIEYNYTITDNILKLDGYFLSNVDNIYKDESISVTIAIPVGYQIYFTGSTNSFLYDIDNTQRIYDNDMVNQHFLMTNIGLECTDCDESVYRN